MHPEPLPPALMPLWQVFSDLSSARPSTGFGPAPISYRDIVAWQDLYGVQLTPWEVDTIRAADVAVLAVMAQANRKPSNG